MQCVMETLVLKRKFKLHKAGCERLIVLPLYPQYAAATTATVCDEVYRVLMKMRWQPSFTNNTSL